MFAHACSVYNSEEKVLKGLYGFLQRKDVQKAVCTVRILLLWEMAKCQRRSVAERRVH